MTLSHLFRGRDPIDSIPRIPVIAGGLVIGFSDTESSRRALDMAGRIPESTAGTLLVCATTRSAAPQHADGLQVALKGDAYLLSDVATTDEILRNGRESVSEHTGKRVESVALIGDPLHVLTHAVITAQASALVIGMRGDRPGPLARRLSKSLPRWVSLIVTDGTDLLRVQPRARRRVSLLPRFAGPVPDPMGV